MELAFDIRMAIFGAISDVVNASIDGCRPMAWSVGDWRSSDKRLHISGFPGAAYSDDEGIAVIAEWVAALGLDLRGMTCPGVVEYAGDLTEDVAVTVWTMVDREAFELDKDGLHGQ